ncbi:MAG TPA: hypothetical protein VFZ27_18710 [Terriglobia bacterium]|nr:hypothetical protein [Terriglobia bacterium]
MSKTAVGLFGNLGLANQVVRDLEASGFPRDDVRILSEPRDMAVTGVMSTPRNDFQVDLDRDLRTVGATEAEAKAYVQGVRYGGILVFASGPDERIEAAAEIMNRHSPVEAEELTGGDLHLPSTTGKAMTSVRNSSIHAGGERYPGAGARVYVR